MKQVIQTVPPKSLDKVLAYLRKGGRVFVSTSYRITILDEKVLARFEKVGAWLIKEDGDGYRIQSGKSSYHVAPGYLKAEAFVNED